MASSWLGLGMILFPMGWFYSVLSVVQISLNVKTNMMNNAAFGVFGLET